jgi:hypothetical protein
MVDYIMEKEERLSKCVWAKKNEKNNNRENEVERDVRELIPNAVFYSVSHRIKHNDVLKHTRKQLSICRLSRVFAYLFLVVAHAFFYYIQPQIFKLEMRIMFLCKRDFDGPKTIRSKDKIFFAPKSK